MRARLTTTLRLALAIASICLLPGCAFDGGDPNELLTRDLSTESTPLGGNSLSQHKREMQRAYRDLIHFHATLEGLQQHRDRNGLVLFRKFVDAYMGRHLEPMLGREWKSEHPEILGTDANIRLLQAQLLMELREPQRMQWVLDEIERRFAGRGDILVDYPIGQQSTLKEAMEILAKRKWRG